MKTITKLLPVLCAVLFIQGCAVAKKDILADRLTKERIYTAINNNSELIELNKEKLKKQDNATNRLALANNYYEIGDFDSALYYIEPLLQKGKDSNAFLLQAKVFDSQGDLDKALVAIDKAIKLDPKNAQAYNVSGIINAQKKIFGVAESDFFKAKGLFLDDNIVNNNLGMLNLAMGNYDEAVNYLLPLYNRGFKDAKVISNLVFALVKSGRDKEALNIISKQHLVKSPKLLVKNLKTLEPNKSNGK